jgi:hypothetical protein
MRKDKIPIPETVNYKIASLELAIITLRRQVTRPHDLEYCEFTPTAKMMLLEAARLGLAEFYKHPELVARLTYPFP